MIQSHRLDASESLGAFRWTRPHTTAAEDDERFRARLLADLDSFAGQISPEDLAACRESIQAMEWGH